MTAKVITDPSALGWKFDSATGRWEWVAVGGIEEAPVDGTQYARQDAAWSPVEGVGSGGGNSAPSGLWMGSEAEYYDQVNDPNTIYFITPIAWDKHFVALALLFAMSLTGCTSLEQRQAHMEKQVEIIQVQKNAEASKAAAEANAKAELYKALAAVAAANPSQASAVTVALAVQGVGEESPSDDTRIVPLQPMVNEGLEFAKVFAAPLANVTTAVATAYINADVAKTQSDNAAAVQINDALQDSRIVEAVANVGIAAAETSGLMVSGDNYTLSDSASISQDQVSTVATTTTTTETTTETNTSSEIADSYNTETNTTTTTTTENTDSFNDNSDNSNNSDNSDNSYVTYGGQQMTLEWLVDFLQESGEPYSFSIGDDVYTDNVEEEVEEGLTCVPTFEGYVCSGG